MSTGQLMLALFLGELRCFSTSWNRRLFNGRAQGIRRSNGNTEQKWVRKENYCQVVPCVLDGNKKILWAWNFHVEMS